jgi:hypothetical protein
MNKASQDMFEAPTFFPDHPKLLPFVVFGTAHLDKLTIAELLLNKGVNCNTFSDNFVYFIKSLCMQAHLVECVLDYVQ